MGLLNRSLDDVQEIRARIASVGGVMDSYSAQFVSYSQQIGDVVKSNTDIRNEVVAVDEKLKKFGVSVCVCAVACTCGVCVCMRREWKGGGRERLKMMVCVCEREREREVQGVKQLAYT